MLESAGLEAVTGQAADVVNPWAARIALEPLIYELRGGVGRVVKHLDHQRSGRIIDPGARAEESMDHRRFVVDRELDHHEGCWLLDRESGQLRAVGLPLSAAYAAKQVTLQESVA